MDALRLLICFVVFSLAGTVVGCSSKGLVTGDGLVAGDVYNSADPNNTADLNNTAEMPAPSPQGRVSKPGMASQQSRASGQFLFRNRSLPVVQSADSSSVFAPHFELPPKSQSNPFSKQQQKEQQKEQQKQPPKPRPNPEQETQPPGVTTLRDIERNLSVTLDVADFLLSELLNQLAQEAGIDLVVTGVPDRPVTVKLVDQSMAETLDVVAAQVNAGWQFRNGAAFLFADKPVVTSYPVDYLNIARRTSSSLGLATQVGSITLDATDSGGGTHSNNSDTRIENLSAHDVWTSLDENLEALLDAVGAADARLIVNREAGLVTVYAGQHLQQTVRRYLNRIESSLARQVLIEATVIEVNLSDEHRKGVDWSLFAGDDEGTSDSFGGTGLSWSQRLHGQSFPDSPDAAQSVPSSLLRIAGMRSGIGSVSATIDLLDRFGDVRILSRPQIIAMNNQSAVLKVVDNRVYFSVEIERSTRNDEQEVSTVTRIHTVPVGLVMNVIPFITENQRIVLNVRPSISRILGFAEDPNPELSLGGVQNSVPEIQVREMESVLSVGSGETVVIGGLMQEFSTYNDRGVPGVSRVPWIGKLFGRSSSERTKSELLVFLKPSIMHEFQTTGIATAK